MSTPIPRKFITVAGLVIVVILAIALIFYAIKFVPAAINRLAGAVYLTQDDRTGEVSATTTATSTPYVTIIEDEPVEAETIDQEIVNAYATTTPVVETPRTGGPLIVPAPPRVTYTYPQTPRLYGYSDLTVSITSVGYMNSSSNSSFREDDEVPDGKRPALKFTVKNVGTNASGQWRLSAELPTNDEDFTFPVQPSLLPGATKNYTIYFDNPETGNNKVMRIIVDYRDDVRESNERNNTDSASLDIED